MNKNFSMLVAAAGLLALVSQAVAAPTLVIVVRHAERGVEPAADPALSPAGTRRAQQLADLLADAHVTAIITTNYRRTQETAMPIARKLDIQPKVIAPKSGAAKEHVQEVIDTVNAQTGVVLVVGHSNTVPEIVAGLSGVPVAPLCENSFSNLFVVSQNLDNRALLRLHFGQPDEPPSVGCQ